MFKKTALFLRVGFPKATRVSSWDQLHVDKNAEAQTDRDPFWEQLHVETRDKHSNSDQALTWMLKYREYTVDEGINLLQGLGSDDDDMMMIWMDDLPHPKCRLWHRWWWWKRSQVMIMPKRTSNTLALRHREEHSNRLLASWAPANSTFPSCHAHRQIFSNVQIFTNV